MHEPLQKAIRIYEQHNADFSDAIGWHLANGCVVSIPNAFLMGYFCSKDDSSTPLPHADANCLRVTMCVGNMFEATTPLIGLAEWVTYEREIKGDPRVRTVNFIKLYQKLKWAA